MKDFEGRIILKEDDFVIGAKRGLLYLFIKSKKSGTWSLYSTNKKWKRLFGIFMVVDQPLPPKNLAYLLRTS